MTTKPIYHINENVSWNYLSLNPNAIHLLEQNQDKIDWKYLSSNPNAISMIAKLDFKK
jgi:hypothetical protein